MYTMVLMMAASGGGDAAAFNFKRGGCHGSSCTGVVVATAPVCVAPAPVCPTPVASCHGGGFLGLRGLFHRGNGCHATPVCAPAAPACCPTPAPACCPTPAPACGGCGTSMMATAPVMMTGMPMMSGCYGGTMTTPGVISTTPVTKPADMPKDPVKTTEPKKEDPKKDEPKKED